MVAQEKDLLFDQFDQRNGRLRRQRLTPIRMAALDGSHILFCEN